MRFKPKLYSWNQAFQKYIQEISIQVLKERTIGLVREIERGKKGKKEVERDREEKLREEREGMRENKAF